MIELAASVSSDQFASRCIASEKKNVESVGLGDELLLRDLLLAPEVFGSRRKRLELASSRFIYVLLDDFDPLSAF